MKMLALLLSLVSVAGVAGALDSLPEPTTGSKAAAPAAKADEIAGEVVSVEPSGLSITLKTTATEDRTLAVAPEAQAAVAALKAGDKVTLRQNDAGVVTGVKAVGGKRPMPSKR